MVMKEKEKSMSRVVPRRREMREGNVGIMVVGRGVCAGKFVEDMLGLIANLLRGTVIGLKWRWLSSISVRLDRSGL